MRQVTKILLLLAFMHGINCLCAENVEQADSASQILLRLRTPGNKKIKKVNINEKKHKAFDVKSETIDLTGKTELIHLSVRY